MEEGFVKVLSFVIFIIIGYCFRHYGLLKEEAFRVLSSVALYITLPCLIIHSLNGVPIDPSMLWLILVGIGCNCFTVFIGWRLGRKEGTAGQAFSMQAISGYNIGTFAMPFLFSFLSPEGFVALCLFDAGNSVMCTGGTYALAKTVLKGEHSFSVTPFLKSVFSSIIFCLYLVMIPLALLEISLPQPIVVFTKIGGDANAFLAMLMIGVAVRLHMDAKSVKQMFSHTAVRYLSSVVLAALLYFLLPFDREIRLAVALAVFAPVAAISLVFVMKMQGDIVLASNINSLTIVLGILTISGLLMVL